MHRRLAKDLLGIDDRASSIIDAPSKTLGPGHRKVGHTPMDAARMLALKGELDAKQMKAALLHIAVDSATSRFTKRQKQYIEILLSGDRNGNG